MMMSVKKSLMTRSKRNLPSTSKRRERLYLKTIKTSLIRSGKMRQSITKNSTMIWLRK
jgi:hypothetical protein